MTLALLGVVILGSLLFAVYCLVGYYERVSPLRAEAETLEEAVEQKRRRLEELERDVESLRESPPQIERKTIITQRWIDRLKAQHERLESRSKPAQGEVERHIEAVRTGEDV